MKKNFGYNVWEIVIAISIIAIFALCIGFVLGFWKDKANDSQKVSDIRKIRQSLELYYDKYAEYPGNLFELVEDGLLTNLPTPPIGSIQKEYIYVPLGENGFCTNYHIGIPMKLSGTEYLKGDKDAYKQVICRKATSKDFDGTADNCSSDASPKGIKSDSCYDLNAF